MHYSSGGFKEATPKKRQSGTGSMTDDDDNLLKSSDEDQDVSMNTTDIRGDVMNDWEDKGKKRE
jgi:hypothetical protein